MPTTRSTVTYLLVSRKFSSVAFGLRYSFFFFVKFYDIKHHRCASMLAVLIKGNPKFINTELAKHYYRDIENFLKSIGFKVELDAGADYTRPRQDADLYIGHSRGAGRYEFMEPKNKSKFLRFGDPDGIIDPVDRKWQKENPPPTDKHPPHEHFIFSEEQKNAILKKMKELGLKVSMESHNESVEDAKHRLLDMAMNDPFLGPAALPVDINELELIITKNGEYAGFITPMKGGGNYRRVGSIFVDPKFRGKGVARDFVVDYFKDKPGQSWIRPDNKPSQGTFKAAGFFKTGKTQIANGKLYEEWVNQHQTFRW